MIWETFYWKKPLWQSAKTLRNLKGKRITDLRYAKIEREVCLGFFTVRRLFETPAKMTDRIRHKQIQICWHPNVKKVTWRNYHNLDELYDFEKERMESRTIGHWANIVIHSLIFNLMVDELGGFDGIYFSSDNTKDEKLYSMTVDTVLSTFESVAKDDVMEMRWWVDPKTGKEHWILR